MISLPPAIVVFSITAVLRKSLLSCIDGSIFFPYINITPTATITVTTHFSHLHINHSPFKTLYYFPLFSLSYIYIIFFEDDNEMTYL